MPSSSTYAVFLATAIVLLLVPGPAVLYVVTRSIEMGRAGGLASVAGITTGTVAYVALATAGLSSLILASSAAFDAVKYVGAAYLFLLGRPSPRLCRDCAGAALARRGCPRRPRDPRGGVDAEPRAVTIRDLRPDDWPAVRTIYEQGIRSGHATFETETPAWERWDAAHPELRLVAELDGTVAGWAALSPASARHCYRGVGEVSVYVAEEARGAGLGRTLLEELVERSEQAGYWTLTAGVFPENEASVRLHNACGFREVGVRERLGRLDGVWRDVVLLERRSDVVG